MNSTGDNLRLAVLANPADNLPRLVYADWLEENGQEEYASFIRLQCELTSMPAVIDKYERLTKESRLAIIAHGETWAKHATPSGTTSGNYAAFDKLADKRYGMICRLPADAAYRDMSNDPPSYTFDVSDYGYWRNNVINWQETGFPRIEWTYRSLERDRQNKSGIAFTNGFPSHWRGKCLDWFTKVGRSAVVNYPIERVEFCDLIFEGGHQPVLDNEIGKRYPQLYTRYRLVKSSEIVDIQNQLSRLVIDNFK